MTASIAELGEKALRRLGVAIVPEAERPALAMIVAPATIATNTLVELGVIASDETPIASDQALALAKVNAVHDSMVAQAFVRWGVNAIPQAVAEEYTKLAALFAASSFGKQGDPQMLPVLEQRVRKVAMVMQAPDEAFDAVMAVHQHLTATGIARWSVFDLPDYVNQAYEILAANLLAPSFGAQPDLNAGVAAEKAVAKYVALESSGASVRAEYF